MAQATLPNQWTNVEDLKRIDTSKIDTTKTYEATIQIGPMASWRKYRGSRNYWREQSGAPPGRRVYRYDAPVIPTGPISGRDLIGLVERHNDWFSRNRKGERPGGLLNRMIVVTGWVESSEPAADEPSVPIKQSQLEALVERVAIKTFEALVGSKGSKV